MTPHNPNDQDPLNNHQDSAGDTPGQPGANWSWNEQNLVVGEYVGFPLYTQLKDRLCSTSIPDKDHNRVIMCMIDMHDDELTNKGVGCSTLVCGVGNLEHGMYQKVSILEADHVAPFEDVKNWFDLLDGPFPLDDID